MSFFTNLRAERLIAEIKAAGDGSGDTARSLDKLARLGPSAIPRIVDALANADRQERAGFVNVLASLIDNKSLPIGHSSNVKFLKKLMSAPETWDIIIEEQLPHALEMQISV